MSLPFKVPPYEIGVKSKRRGVATLGLSGHPQLVGSALMWLAFMVRCPLFYSGLSSSVCLEEGSGFSGRVG